MQVSGQWVTKHRTGYWKGPTTIHVCCKPVRRYHQLMAGSGTMLSRGSCRDWNATRSSEQNRRHRRVITPSLYLTRLGTSSQWSSVCISCLRPRSNFRVPQYHWLHELPSSTLVATCWRWSLEPQRRQRYSSRCGKSRRRARASRQTPKSVSAGCAVVDADGGSWRCIWGNAEFTCPKIICLSVKYHNLTIKS